MIKHEQSRSINQLVRTVPIAPVVSIPQPQPPHPVFQPVSGVLSQRLIDPNAIDLTSLKGQFAWEKISQNDTYMPVIFRGETKYFCVRMLRKILPDYPEDVIRRSYQYQYRKPIAVYPVTKNEAELLNRINSHHSRGIYSRQPFNALDEVVRVSDFLPFYEHLRHSCKSTSIVTNTTAHTLRQLLPQPQQNIPRSSEFVTSMPIITRGQSNVQQETSLQIPPFRPRTEFPHENTPSNVRPSMPASSVQRPQRPSKSIGNPYAVVLPIRPSSYSIIQQQLSQPSMSSHTTNTVPPNHNHVIASNLTPVSLTPSTSSSSSSSCSSSSSPNVLSSTNDISSCVSSATKVNGKSSVLPPTSASKTTSLHAGWLQINKLYTPYVAATSTDHHLYKIPVSLLLFYDLLKTSGETNDSKEALLNFPNTLVTSQELELINDLCIKQNIKPFSIDTKLMQLSIFYQQCSANIIFVKELPLHEPKSSICKEWLSIIKINGGICRLRNIATLHEQTVPFIGNNLLKNFTLSSQCLSTASLTKPTAAELEFLQLILFFSNMPINLSNAQLIDIESVRKEYNVDLILLFNDKFPLNVLNYQQQDNQLNTSQVVITSNNAAATTNTIAESTPPPSPPSPVANQAQPNNPSQLPLKSSTNRYHKTVQFRGHPLTAYICSGLGSNTQRECVSIKSLCKVLYPNSTSLHKLEAKMLRLLRAKSINRFRPQNQQTIGFTRLIDIKDAEKHWEYIAQEMCSMLSDNTEVHTGPTVSSVSDENLQASTVERVDSDVQISTETSVTTNISEKRPFNLPLDDEDTPISERLNKRIRLTEKENDEHLTESSEDHRTQLLQNGNALKADQITDTQQTIQSNSIQSIRKRRLPSNRTKKQSKAAWVRKYDIEGCCIQLDRICSIDDVDRD